MKITGGIMEKGKAANKGTEAKDGMKKADFALRDEELDQISGGGGIPSVPVDFATVYCDDCDIEFRAPQSIIDEGRKIPCPFCRKKNTHVV